MYTTHITFHIKNLRPTHSLINNYYNPKKHNSMSCCIE